MPDTLERKKNQIELRQRIHVPIRRLMYPKDSISILEEGVRIAKEIDDQKSFILFFSLIGMYHSSSGDPLKSISYQEECFKKASEIEDVDIMAPLADDLTLTYWATGEYVKLAEVSKKAILLIEKEGRETDFFGRSSCVYTTMLGMHGVGLGVMGNFKGGKEWLTKSLYLAQQNMHKYSLALSEMMFGLFYLNKTDGHKSRGHIENALRFFQESGSTFYSGWAIGNLGKNNLILGNYKKAEELIKEGIRIISDLNVSIGVSYFKLCAGEVNFEMGRFDNANNYFHECFDLSLKYQDRFSEGMSLIWIGRTEYKINPSQYKNALSSISNGMNILLKLNLKSYHTCGLLFLGEIYSGNGETEAAIDCLSKAKNRFRKMGMDYWLAKTLEILNRI